LRIFALCLILFVVSFARERVVALSPAINEIIYALGEGDSIVANTDFCNYPEDSKTKKKVGGYFSPSLEAIISVKPTAVIMQENNIKIAQKLESLGIKTVMVKIDKMADIRDSILKIGAFYAQEANASALVAEIDKALDATKNITKEKKILMVFGTQSDLTKQIFVSGQNLYFNDIIEHSGNKNAFYSTLKGQPIINMERVITLNPDIVIFLAPYLREENSSIEKLTDIWKTLPINASKNGNLYVLDKEYAGIASDRIIDFLQDFRGYLIDSASR